MNIVISLLSWMLLIDGVLSTILKFIAKHEGDGELQKYYEVKFILVFIAWILLQILSELL
jgi:hypothetical protein